MKTIWHDMMIYSCLATYLIGGVLIFSGIGLVALFEDLDLLGWGRGDSIGYLGVCLGLGLNIMAVLGMRLLRNRIPIPSKKIKAL